MNDPNILNKAMSKTNKAKDIVFSFVITFMNLLIIKGPLIVIPNLIAKSRKQITNLDIFRLTNPLNSLLTEFVEIFFYLRAINLLLEEMHY